jgi:hypothetical protein
MGMNDTKEIAPLAGRAKAKQLEAIREKYKGETGATHQRRILDALRLGPLSTFDARKHLDVPHPAGRIQELRDIGHVIDTVRISEPGEIGRPHCIARYILCKEARR